MPLPLRHKKACRSLVDEKGVIIVGHARLLGAHKLGLTQVPVHVAVLTESTEGLTDEDEAPVVQEFALTQPSDLWILGNHRLLCGDSTSMDAVERLMNGQKADLVFTDPPYNVDYQGYTEEKLKIEGDKMSPDQFREFLGSVFACYVCALKPDRSGPCGGNRRSARAETCSGRSPRRFNVRLPSVLVAAEFQGALELSDFEVRRQIIWAMTRDSNKKWDKSVEVNQDSR